MKSYHCSMSTLKLSLLSTVFFGLGLHAQEICNNAIDDDGDGAIDLNDPECICAGTLNDGVTSLLPNRSFEERVEGIEGQPCCPWSFVHVGSLPYVSCSDGWGPATDGTTDYMHTCGWMPEPVAIQPAPAGDGFMGVHAFPGYFEYIGRGIGPTPLLADVDYTMQLWVAPTWANEHHTASTQHIVSEPTELSLFGQTVSAPLPVNTFGCIGETPGWVELGTVQVMPSASWQPVLMKFTPASSILALAFGGACDLPGYLAPRAADTASYSPYFLLDDMILTTSDQFAEGITRTGSLCTNDLVLTAPMSTGQWYRNGIALVGSTDPVLDLSTENADGGLYSFLGTDMGTCTRADLHVEQRPSFTATPDVGFAPLEVTLVATSTNGTAHWLFDDGTEADGDTVVHIFEDPGTYWVTIEHEVDGCMMSVMVDDAIEVQFSNGLEERYGLGRMSITPNPVQDLVRANPGMGYTGWSIMNALGQVVASGPVINGRIEAASPEARGSYVLRAEGNGRIATARFIKP